MNRLNIPIKLRNLGLSRIKSKTWYFSRSLHGEIVSNRDLYSIYGDLGTTRERDTSSFYSRRSPSQSGNRSRHSPLEKLEPGSREFKHFKSSLEAKTHNFQKYLGKRFELSDDEALCIACGLMNFDLMYRREDENASESENIFKGCDIYSTNKLRAYGKQVFEMQISLRTTFNGLSFLSLSAEDVKYSIALFSNEKYIIPKFMKNNLLYNSVHPFRGASRTTSFSSPEDYDEEMKRIHEVSCIGSFYTLLGLLLVKYNKETVIDDFIVNEVIQGPNGLVALTTDKILEGRER